VTRAAYPVFVDVSRCRVLVVGGGAVAARKVRGLTDAGSRPEIVAPALDAGLRTDVERLGLAWHARPYAPGDARGSHLVFAATDDPAVNAAIAAEAEANGALANVADDGPGSIFHVPSAIRRDEVVVALSTGGASPLLARRLREALETVVTPGLGRTARRLALLRREVRARWPGDEARRRAFWFELVTSDFLDLAVAGSDEDVERHIERCLSQS
jgi:siroheme synthase-like protein